MTPQTPTPDHTPTPDQALRTMLAEHCFVRDLPAQTVDRVVEHALVATYAAGDWVFRAGSSATRLHLVVHGRVAVSVHAPGRGDEVVDTVEECQTLGWSWLVPPYRWYFDARALSDVTLVTVDAVALRDLADADPTIGYPLMRQAATVMVQRMQAARVRVADLYRPTT